jgi:hypothetical protein
MHTVDVKLQAYRVFDIGMTSAFSFPELGEIGAGITGLSLEVAAASGTPGDYSWFHHWTGNESDDEIYSSIAREHGGYRVRYPDLADFVINAKLDHVRCFPLRGVSKATLRHIFLDNVIPRILGQRGQMIVHASAVRAREGSTFAFLGESGWGKSTLASKFYSQGYELITDDCLKMVVAGNTLTGVPAYQGVRLRDDSISHIFPADKSSQPVADYSDKRRIGTPAAPSGDSAEIRHLYLLSNPALGNPALGRQDEEALGPTIKEVSGSEAIMALIRRSFFLDVEDMPAAARRLEMAHEIVSSSTLISALDFTRDYALLDQVVKAVEESHRADTGAGETRYRRKSISPAKNN